MTTITPLHNTKYEWLDPHSLNATCHLGLHYITSHGNLAAIIPNPDSTNKQASLVVEFASDGSSFTTSIPEFAATNTGIRFLTKDEVFQISGVRGSIKS